MGEQHAGGNPVATLVPTRPDREVADDLRRRLLEAMAPVAAICSEAHALEFQVGLNFERDPFGRLRTVILLTKVFSDGR